MTGTLRERRGGRSIADRIVRASGPWGRAFGLLGRTRLEPSEGMWFDGVGAIHTFGMRMAIDVVFLDRNGVVLALFERLGPWRAASAWGARDTLELGAGVCRQAGIGLGSELEVEWHSST